MNKHILILFDNELNPYKYTKKDLAENKKSATAAGAAYVAYGYGTASWLNNYFESTGENKQDYIDKINKDNSVRELDLITKAVCEFKCELPEDTNFNYIAVCGIKCRFSWGNRTEELFNSSWEYVCNESEFNDHIKELSGCPLALKKWQDGLEAQKKPVSNIVYHEGKGYEVGAIYEFSNNDDKYMLGVLTGRSCDDLYPFLAGNIKYALCRKSKNKIGTIKEQSIELIDGECYQFDCESGRVNGVYSFSCNRFVCLQGGFQANICTNIKSLTLAK